MSWGIEDPWDTTTDINFAQGSTSGTSNLWWYMDPLPSGTDGDEVCLTTGANGKCVLGRIRINNGTNGSLQSRPGHYKNNVWCHEFGHLVGYNHPDPQNQSSGSSCTSAGLSSDLAYWEVSEVNTTY
jgi:hypothetical protein